MNIINAIINLVNNPITTITATYQNKNRANSAGDALEEYVKDLFAGSFDLAEKERVQRLSEVFSYLGNSTNPPDSMLKGGDAIEVKKIETKGAALALNSSYPKHTLKFTSTSINSACRTAEDWTEKDMIYVVGVLKSNKLLRMSMVYGMDYCASEETYVSLRNRISEAAETAPDVEFEETNELAHINQVDPLGITYMRVRGMWGIKNPWTVFSYVYDEPANSEFDFMCIIGEEKYNSFENVNELEALAADKNNKLTIERIKVKNPDNPAQLRDARLITYFKGVNQ